MSFSSVVRGGSRGSIECPRMVEDTFKEKIDTELPLFCKKFELMETFFEFMCEEGDESASFEIQLIILDIF